MDLAKVVKYERLFTLSLKHPSTDAEVGVVFKIRSSESREAKDILAKHMDAGVERRFRGKLPTPEQLIEDEAEKAASYIASWDWGENTYDGVVPELSMKTAMHILKNQGWIYEQVVREATKIANFTETPGSSSPPTSE